MRASAGYLLPNSLHSAEQLIFLLRSTMHEVALRWRNVRDPAPGDAPQDHYVVARNTPRHSSIASSATQV